MKKKFISALLFGALIVASSTAVVSCKDYDDDISSLRTEITTNAKTLESMVTEKETNLKSLITALETQETQLSSQLTTAKSDLQAAIDAAAATASSQASAAEASAKTYAEAQAAAAETNAKNYADIQAAAAQVAAIEAAQTEVANAKAQLEAALAEANVRIAALETSTSSNASKITTLEEALDILKSSVASNADKISALAQADEELSTAINTAKAEVAEAAAQAKTAADKAQEAADNAQATADAAVAAAKQNAENLNTISSNLETIQSNLQSQITTLSDNVTKLQAEVSENKATVDGQLATVTANIESNTKAIEALTKSLAADKAELSNSISESKKELLQTIADDKAELLKKITSNTTNLTELGTQLNTLKGVVDANLETAKQYAEAQVAALEASLGKKIEAVQTGLNAVLAKADANAKAIEEVKESVNALKTSLEDADKVINARIDAAILAAETAHLGLVSSIADVNSKLETLAQNAASKAALDSTNTELYNTQIALDDLSGFVNGKMQTQLNTAINDIGTVSSDLASVKSSLDQLTQDVSDYMEANEEARTEWVMYLQNGYNTAIAEEAEKAEQNLATAVSGLENKLSALESAYKAADEDLQKQITELQNRIGEATGSEELMSLQSQIDELIKELNDAFSTESASASNIQTAIANMKKSIEDRLTSMESVIAKNAEDIKKNAQNIAANAEDIAANSADIRTNAEDIKKNAAAIEKNVTDITSLYKALYENEDCIQNQITQAMNLAQNNLDEATAGIQSTIESLQVLLSAQLKALVFSPYAYYEGIEAIAVNSYKYKKITDLKDADVTVDQTNDKPDSAAVYTYATPIIKANYFLNPSNAEVNLNNFSYIINNASMYTRASDGDLVIDSVKAPNSRGEITVYSSLKKGASLLNDEDGKIDVAALRYKYQLSNGEDTTITSDFAALKQFTMGNFQINKVEKEGAVDSETKHTHLATTAAAAVAVDENGDLEAPYLTIRYDDLDGINLDEWINVHYDINGQTDKLWGGQKTLNKEKFNLKYELIGYILNDVNKTNQSKHATINGNILTVHDLNGKQGTPNIIGRRPLVRVTLNDEINGTIAQVGYFVVEITDNIETVEIDNIDPKTNAYTFDCDPSGNAFTGIIAWDEIENKVLGDSAINMSKTDFQNLYTFDADAIYVKSGNEFVKAEDLGEVTWSSNADPEAHGTNILKWTVTQEEAYDYFVGDKQTSMVVYARFAKNGASNGNGDIYIKLTWTPSAVNDDPTVKLEDDAKIYGTWYKKGTNSLGKEEVHMQFANAASGGPTEATAVGSFEDQLTLDNTFKTTPAAQIKKSLESGVYAGLADDLVVTYELAEKSLQTKQSYTVGNKTYNIVIDNSDETVSKLKAECGGNTETLVEIDKTTGKVTVNKNSEFALKIINSAAYSKDITDALTFSIQVNATACGDNGEMAAEVVTIENGKFDVRVIKPLYVTSITSDDMQWSKQSTLIQNVTVGFHDYVGYTPAAYDAEAATVSGNVKFFKFYGVESYSIDLSKIVSNYGLSAGSEVTDVEKFVEIPDNTFSVEFGTYDNSTKEFTAATATNDVIEIAHTGVATFDSNGNPIICAVKVNQGNAARSQKTIVAVPLTVKYAWGEITEYYKITINAADSGQKAKRR